MSDETFSLTEREKETLRLLLVGYSAKTIARELHLSVHTINDRLRDARRKLGVSSSRDAARLLAEHEKDAPNILAPDEIGGASVLTNRHSPSRSRWGHRLAWLGGGMLMMSLIIAIAITSAVSNGGAQSPSAPSEVVRQAEKSASVANARSWLALVDARDWKGSWQAAGALFRGQITSTQWADAVRPVRQPLGTATLRKLLTVNRTNELPGVPKGEYEVLQFETDFENQTGTVETVTLVREGSVWKVVGYFIR